MSLAFNPFVFIFKPIYYIVFDVVALCVLPEK